MKVKSLKSIVVMIHYRGDGIETADTATPIAVFHPDQEEEAHAYIKRVRLQMRESEGPHVRLTYHYTTFFDRNSEQ